MTEAQGVSALVTGAALASYLNYRFLRLPATIGLMAIALTLSTVLVVFTKVTGIATGGAVAFVNGIDFSHVLLHIMLPFLLFAGALHVKVQHLRAHPWLVAILPTVGVLLATVVTGGLLWLGGRWVGLPVPFMQALLFGALIAPTDPIAVLGILRDAQAPRALETVMAAESLLNDGVGVVLFLTLLPLAAGAGTFDLTAVVGTFLVEAIGGMAIGVAAGWIGYRLLRTVDSYSVEIFLTLGVAMGSYAFADALHASGPLATVAAGVVVGGIGREAGMSPSTRHRLDSFWEVIDEMLNAVLFLLIGLELIVIPLHGSWIAFGALAIGSVLAARFVSVALSLLAMPPSRTLPRGATTILTWGGLRGGIAIALALSLPPSDTRGQILTATYLVVLFAVLVQGLTLKHLMRRITGAAPEGA